MFRVDNARQQRNGRGERSSKNRKTHEIRRTEINRPFRRRAGAYESQGKPYEPWRRYVFGQRAQGSRTARSRRTLHQKGRQN